MSQLVPLLITIVVMFILLRRMRPREGWLASTAKSYRKRPIATVVWLVLLPAILVGLLVGPYYLARELYDTAAPSRDQIRMARIIIGSPIAIPFLAFVVWAFWNNRKGNEQLISRAQAARLEDPTKRSAQEETQ